MCSLAGSGARPRGKGADLFPVRALCALIIVGAGLPGAPLGGTLALTQGGRIAVPSDTLRVHIARLPVPGHAFAVVVAVPAAQYRRPLAAYSLLGPAVGPGTSEAEALIVNITVHPRRELVLTSTLLGPPEVPAGTHATPAHGLGVAGRSVWELVAIEGPIGEDAIVRAAGVRGGGAVGPAAFAALALVAFGA